MEHRFCTDSTGHKKLDNILGAEAGVNVVVAAGKFGDLYLHFLNKYKIMGVR